jgi:hypothetical protein
MTPIGTVGKIKITEDGMIANVKINDTLRYKVIKNIYNLEDKIFFIEFKRIGLLEIIRELDKRNCSLTVEALKHTIKKMDKEIKEIRKSIKHLSLAL